MLDMQAIKKDFPIFKHEKDLVYLDSAATSQTPQVVLDAMDEYYTSFRSNIHRGLYKMGEEASEAYESARASVARFIGATPEEIIFTSGATASSNMLVRMLEESDSIFPKPRFGIQSEALETMDLTHLAPPCFCGFLPSRLQGVELVN